MTLSRRNFLTLCAAAGLATAIDAPSFSQAVEQASLSLHPELSGSLLGPDFLGFSYEARMLSDKDFFSTKNQSLIALITRLGPRGVIRIGGNSSDRTLWRANGDLTPVPNRFFVTPDDLQRLAGFVQATGWRVIYGLNLGSGTAEMAADEAAAVVSALGCSLSAFQIGNEPNLYGRNGLRAKTYTVRDYLSEWRAFADAIRIRVPDAPLAGPDVSNKPSWVAAMAPADESLLTMLSCHYYSEGPGNSPKVTIERMLNSGEHLQKTLLEVRNASLQSGLPYRLTETNSVYNGGKYGVSDTMASALWALDLMCRVATTGGTGVNFHGGTGGAYAPVALGTNGLYHPRPLYYAMLCMAQVGPGSVQRVSLESAPEGITAYGFVGKAATTSIVVINAQGAGDASIAINGGAGRTQLSILRLSGPSLDATSGISLGGAPVGPGGAWQAMVTETSAFNGQPFIVTLPAASAALVSLT